MQPVTSKRRRIRVGRWLSYATTLIILGAAVIGLTQRNAIYDAWQLHNYTASSAISQLATDTTMTSYGKHLFYVNHPSLQSRTSFATYCPSGTEQTVVLGCYKSGERGIYVLNVTNSELAGIQQVTAAHEMLHAGYERLSNSERTKVDAMLMSYYKSGISDSQITDAIAAYKKSEPNDVVNEMHSIFGTEITNLPADLQSYYARYFTNRSVVTNDYQRYEAAFTNRQTEVKNYDTQLTNLRAQINPLESSVASDSSRLKSQRANLDQNSESQVDAYNAAVRTYNSEVNRLQALVAQYNQIVGKRNNIALEEQQLVQSISSSATAQQ